MLITFEGKLKEAYVTVKFPFPSITAGFQQILVAWHTRLQHTIDSTSIILVNHLICVRVPSYGKRECVRAHMRGSAQERERESERLRRMQRQVIQKKVSVNRSFQLDNEALGID